MVMTCRSPSLLWLAALSWFAGLTHATTNITWSGCGPFGNELERLTIGKRTVICLHVGNGLNWAAGTDYVRLSFRPEVDQYSRFHVAGSYNDLVNQDPFKGQNITIGVASQQRVTFLRQYYNVQTRNTYPQLTAIVDVDHGRVRGVTWDDSCVFCGGGECDEITYNYDGVLQSQGSAGQPTGGCPLTPQNCADTAGACDILLYVVWSGSDSGGNALQSAANRFSMFPAQDLGDRWSRSVSSVTNRGDEN